MVGCASLESDFDIAFIENNLHNPELSNQQIADSQGISLRYLHRLFEDEAETIHAMILQKRLEKAKQMLENPDYVGMSQISR